MTGTFSGTTKHPAALGRGAAKHRIDARLARELSLYNAVRATIAQLEAAERARERAAPSSGTLPGARSSGAARIALRYLGVPYVWGGASPKSGFDTSGLVMYVYSKLGVSLPHYSVLQYHYANAVHPARSKLRPGDLVFFDRLDHVGIYIGNDEFVHAPRTGAVVRIQSLSGRYSHEYYGATRILG